MRHIVYFETKVDEPEHKKYKSRDGSVKKVSNHWMRLCYYCMCVYFTSVYLYQYHWCHFYDKWHHLLTPINHKLKTETVLDWWYTRSFVWELYRMLLLVSILALQTKSRRDQRTKNIVVHDNGKSQTKQFSQCFDWVLQASSKRKQASKFA